MQKCFYAVIAAMFLRSKNLLKMKILDRLFKSISKSLKVNQLSQEKYERSAHFLHVLIARSSERRKTQNVHSHVLAIRVNFFLLNIATFRLMIFLRPLADFTFFLSPFLIYISDTLAIGFHLLLKKNGKDTINNSNKKQFYD